MDPWAVINGAIVNKSQILDSAPGMDGVMLGASMNRERIGWRAALQGGIWGCWLAASSAQNNVPWKPRGQPTSWGASSTASPAGLFYSTEPFSREYPDNKMSFELHVGLKKREVPFWSV